MVPLTEAQPTRTAWSSPRARRRKELRYPELVGSGSRACLVVLALEVGGRWSPETRTFVAQLAKAKARREPPSCRRGPSRLGGCGWGAILSCAAAKAVATCFLGFWCAHGADGDGRDLLWPRPTWPTATTCFGRDLALATTYFCHDLFWPWSHRLWPRSILGIFEGEGEGRVGRGNGRGAQGWGGRKVGPEGEGAKGVEISKPREGLGARRVGPKHRKSVGDRRVVFFLGGPKGGGPNFRVFFLLPPPFRSFRVSLGVFSWPQGCRGFTRQPESPNVHISGSWPSTEDTQRETKKSKNGAGEGKKERNFGRSGGRGSRGGGGPAEGGVRGHTTQDNTTPRKTTPQHKTTPHHKTTHEGRRQRV